MSSSVLCDIPMETHGKTPFPRTTQLVQWRRNRTDAGQSQNSDAPSREGETEAHRNDRGGRLKKENNGRKKRRISFDAARLQATFIRTVTPLIVVNIIDGSLASWLPLVPQILLSWTGTHSSQSPQQRWEWASGAANQNLKPNFWHQWFLAFFTFYLYVMNSIRRGPFLSNIRSNQRTYMFWRWFQRDESPNYACDSIGLSIHALWYRYLFVCSLCWDTRFAAFHIWTHGWSQASGALGGRASLFTRCHWSSVLSAVKPTIPRVQLV